MVDNTKRNLLLIFSLYLIFTSVLYINLPISEDESNIYFVSQKWNEGHTPFKEYFGDSKAPGMYYYISTFIRFTNNIQLLRLSIFFANIVSAFFVYLICTNLFDKKKGILATIFFLAIHLFPGMNGYFFINDRFLVLFSLASVYLFLRAGEDKKYILASGLMAGIAMVFKQLAVTLPLLFIVFYFCLLLRKKKKFKSVVANSAILIIGFIIPITMVALHFFLIGGLKEMIYWTSNGVQSEFNTRGILLHPEEITSLGHLYQFSVMAPFWIASLIISILFIIKLLQKKISDSELFLLLFMISALPVMVTLLDFQASQFAPLAIMSAVFFANFKAPKSTAKKIIVYVFIIFIILLSVSLNLYSEYNLQTTRYGFYKQEIDAAKYVKDHTSQNESIYVFGYRPSIYILSERNPPSNVPVMANFNIQVKGKYENETISALQEQNIIYIVHETMTSPEDAPVVFDYIQENYKVETSIGRLKIYHKI